MANYPTSLDTFTNPTGADSLSSPSHSLQHADANDAIEALEAKVGIGTSTAGSATAGHVLVASTGGTTSWTTVGASAINTTGGTAGQYLSAGTAGVATWADLTPSAETVISTGTFTAVSAVNLSNVLSDTYKFYNLYVSGYTQTSAQEIQFRFRENTTDKSTGYYAGGVQGNYLGSTASRFSRNNGSNLAITAFYNDSRYYGSAKVTIYRPHATTGYTTGLFHDKDASAWGSTGGENVSMTNFNGLSFFPAGQTMTGYYVLTGVK